MSERPSGNANSAIVVLGALLVIGIVLVMWLAGRPAEEPAADPPRKPVAAKAPSSAEPPKSERPRSLDPDTIVRKTEPPPIEEDTPEERDTLPLAVEVFAANGAAAAGATVLLADPFAQHAGPARPSEVARATTDAGGVAHFDVHRRTLRAYAWYESEAGASDKFVPSETRSRVAVRMSPAIIAKGRVQESGGLPVADADVRFVARPWLDDPFGLRLETKTNGYGVFELPPLPLAVLESAAPGTLAIEARAKGWPAARVAVTSDMLRAGEVVVTLERGAFLRGRFAQPSGAAVAGEWVRTANGASVAASESDGRFELPLPRDGGVVIARRGSPLDRTTAAVSAASGWGAPKLLGRFRGDRGDIDLGDVTLVAGQPVKGVVVDLQNQPVKAGDVVAYLAGVQVAATQTGDDGKFEFDAIGDDPHVVVATEPPGENAWSGRRHASASDVRGGATDLRIQITGALTVLVKFLAEADRTPVVVPQVSLQAVGTGATPQQYGWSWAGQRIDNVRFEVEHAGTYDVTVELPGYEPATARGVTVSAEQEFTIDVLFRKLP